MNKLFFDIHKMELLFPKKIFSWILVTIYKEVVFKISPNNKIRTHNHLVCKRTLNHLVKLALKFQISCLFQGKSPLTFRQIQSVNSL